ncbi:MAG: PH domain-containing protein [Chitinophagaceae bacterium]
MNDKQIFRTGISWWLVGFVGVVLGGTSILAAKDGAWVAVLINTPILLWFVHTLMNTYYTIENETLTITCGVFPKLRIPIREIIHIKETNNPLSSPAFSMDRLEIKYEKRKFVLISPKQKDAFIEILLRVHPKIEVKRKRSSTKITPP